METQREVLCVQADARLEDLESLILHEARQPLGLTDLVQFRLRKDYPAYWDKHIVALASRWQCPHGHWFVACLHEGQIHFRCVGRGFSATDNFLVE